MVFAQWQHKKQSVTEELQHRKLLPVLLQKLVGDFFFDFLEGNLVGILAGILRDSSDPKNKGSNISGKISEHSS